MTLLDRHLGFLNALREAGLSVSLAEGLDALAAVKLLSWQDREAVRLGYATTVVKRQVQRPTFDTLFDVWFPRATGEGYADPLADVAPHQRDSPQALANLRDRLAEALSQPEVERESLLTELAVEAVARFGALPGRGVGEAAWSAYTALRRVAPSELIEQLVAGLQERGVEEARARIEASARVAEFTQRVEQEARRRLVEQKGPQHVSEMVVRPTIDRLDFTAVRRDELAAMRREVQQLAKRMATRLAQERHSRRRGPLDFRRTMRASMASGGVPLVTHHRPKRPHRSELVVLCDVSGSVANFAHFTLLLVMALREQFTQVRAFTFVDDITEVTSQLRSRDASTADPADVLAKLAASAEHASRFGRTDYGRAFTKFAERYADAVGPRTSLLVLGDARSNYANLAEPVLRDLADRARQSWWLNPEHPRQWGVGDSAAFTYGAIVPMIECRNLTQLGEFVHEVC